MRAFEFGRWALSVCAAAALLSACGGSSIPQANDNTPSDVAATKNSTTFKYTGGEQTFRVPKGVSQLTVVAHGGEGAGFSTYPSTDTPGRPGRVYAIIPVSPGEKLYVFVGGSGTHGGFNGGGTGGTPSSSYGNYPGNPGGGASDVRAGGTGILDRIIVAAGGGGAGQSNVSYGSDYGGNGGGEVGKMGAGGGGASSPDGGGGGGGTQREGGAGGAAGYSYSSGRGKPGGGGTLGLGGNGGDSICDVAGGGGGGGGGYYGGGGGGGAALTFYCYYPSQGGGGGGGSSYVEPSAIKSRVWTGWKAAGDGLVVFSWD
jgi:hypothetical protein